MTQNNEFLLSSEHLITYLVKRANLLKNSHENESVTHKIRIIQTLNKHSLHQLTSVRNRLFFSFKRNFLFLFTLKNN